MYKSHIVFKNRITIRARLIFDNEKKNTYTVTTRALKCINIHDLFCTLRQGFIKSKTSTTITLNMDDDNFLHELNMIS